MAKRTYTIPAGEFDPALSFSLNMSDDERKKLVGYLKQETPVSAYQRDLQLGYATSSSGYNEMIQRLVRMAHSDKKKSIRVKLAWGYSPDNVFCLLQISDIHTAGKSESVVSRLRWVVESQKGMFDDEPDLHALGLAFTDALKHGDKLASEKMKKQILDALREEGIIPRAIKPPLDGAELGDMWDMQDRVEKVFGQGLGIVSGLGLMWEGYTLERALEYRKGQTSDLMDVPVLTPDGLLNQVANVDWASAGVVEVGPQRVIELVAEWGTDPRAQSRRVYKVVRVDGESITQRELKAFEGVLGMKIKRS